jgi:polynucleotide 5'-kinase involved in rRNA processing
VNLGKGTSLLARGPLRVQVLEGSVLSRGVRFGPSTEPLVAKAWETFDIEVHRPSRISTAGVGSLTKAEPYPREWTEFLDSGRLSRGETAMVIGGTDTGKSTLCLLMANRSLGNGTVQVLDGDVGQSDIGPPTTVGLGRLSRPVLRLSDAELVNASFLGNTSPAYCLRELVEGTKEMANLGRTMGGAMIVDTTGLVTGSLGEHLTKELVRVAEPDELVLLQRGDELQYLAETGINLQHLPPLCGARKDLGARRAFRRSRFLGLFGQASPISYDLSRLKIEHLQTPRPDGTEMPWGYGDSLEKFGGVGTLVGLYAGRAYLDLGLLRRVYRQDGTIEVLTRETGRADRMVLGNLRIGDDGQETLIEPASGETGFLQKSEAEDDEPPGTADR